MKRARDAQAASTGRRASLRRHSLCRRHSFTYFAIENTRRYYFLDGELAASNRYSSTEEQRRRRIYFRLSAAQAPYIFQSI